MTYIPASRDFEQRPANRYAALRSGLHADGAVAASDLHRLSARLVKVAVGVVVLLGLALVLPAAFAAVGDIAGVYDSLSPTPR